MNFKYLLNNTELKQIQQEDNSLLLELLKIRNEIDIRNNMINQSIIEVEEHITWVNKQLISKNKKLFYVLYKSDLKGFASVDLKDKSWAFYLTKDSVNGLGAIVEYIFLKKIFNNLKLDKIYCEVFDYNERVIKLHKKFGFKEISSKQKYSEFKKQNVNLIKLELGKINWNKSKKKIDELII